MCFKFLWRESQLSHIEEVSYVKRNHMAYTCERLDGIHCIKLQSANDMAIFTPNFIGNMFNVKHSELAHADPNCFKSRARSGEAHGADMITKRTKVGYLFCL